MLRLPPSDTLYWQHTGKKNGRIFLCHFPERSDMTQRIIWYILELLRLVPMIQSIFFIFSGSVLFSNAIENRFSWIFQDIREITRDIPSWNIWCLIRLFHGPWGVERCFVKPLLKKKLGIELIFLSFRPVSNVLFISKLTKKALVNQLSDHINKVRPLSSG